MAVRRVGAEIVRSTDPRDGRRTSTQLKAVPRRPCRACTATTPTKGPRGASGSSGSEGSSAHLKGRDLTADEVDALAEGRYAFINVWRSIDKENAVARSPLAVCDEASVDRRREVQIRAALPGPHGRDLLARHSEKHKWYWYPGMSHDECLVFKC